MKHFNNESTNQGYSGEPCWPFVLLFLFFVRPLFVYFSMYDMARSSII